MTKANRIIPSGPWCVDSKNPRIVRMATAPGHTLLATRSTRMGNPDALASICSALPELLELQREVSSLNFSYLAIGAGKMARLEFLCSEVEKRISMSEAV